MVDNNFEVHSSASSDISESLRDLILGRVHRRKSKTSAKSTQSQNTLSSYVLVPSKETSFEKVDRDRTRGSGGDSRNLSYHSAQTGSGFEVVPKNEKNRSSFEVLSKHDAGSGFEVLPEHDTGSGFEVLSKHTEGSGFEVLPKNEKTRSSFEVLSKHDAGSGLEVLSKHTEGSGFEVVPKKQKTRSSFEVLSKHDTGSGFEVLSKHDAGSGFEVLSKHTEGSGFEVVPKNQKTRSSFEVLSKHDTGSGFEVLSKHTEGSGFEIVPKDEKNRSSFEVLSKHDTGSGFEVVSKHTAGSGFEVLPKHPTGSNFEVVSPNSKSSMKNSNDKHYTTIETQTVAIQTVTTGIDTDWNSRCSWEDQPCDCEECESPRICRFGRSIKRIPEETPTTSASENFTQSSSQTIDVRTRDHCGCQCKCSNCKCPRQWEESSDQFSDSDESYTTDFFDLPYQNNEEYLKLLKELEKKLIARNRERFKKAMTEFEKKSRLNQNLDKPVYEYNDDGASMLRKITSKQHRNPVCCKCGRNKRVNSDILQNEKRWDEMNFVESVTENESKTTPLASRIERSLHKSHWQLDPRSGEWIKVSCFQQCDFARPVFHHGDFHRNENKKLPPGGGMCKKDCRCRQKKKRM